jgi:hypothetical protein
MQSRLTVYNFYTLDSGYESSPVSTFKATRKAIVEIFGGDPIEGTAESVPADAVDEQGRYRRLATGWGELS